MDGPLVEVGDAGSDDEEVLEGDTGEAFEGDGEGKGAEGLRRRGASARKSLPKGGPAFGFTQVDK